MKFVANGVKYDFDPNKITFAEAKAMQKVTQRTVKDITSTADEDAESMQAIFWVAMKRQDPTLTYLDLDDTPITDIEGIPEDDIPPVDGDADPTQLDTEPGGASTPSE